MLFELISLAMWWLNNDRYHRTCPWHTPGVGQYAFRFSNALLELIPAWRPEIMAHIRLQINDICTNHHSIHCGVTLRELLWTLLNYFVILQVTELPWHAHIIQYVACNLFIIWYIERRFVILYHIILINVLKSYSDLEAKLCPITVLIPSETAYQLFSGSY